MISLVVSALLIPCSVGLECLNVDTRIRASFDLIRPCADDPDARPFIVKQYGVDTADGPSAGTSIFALSNDGDGYFCGETGLGVLNLGEEIASELVFYVYTVGAGPVESTFGVKEIKESLGEAGVIQLDFNDFVDWKHIEDWVTFTGDDVNVSLLLCRCVFEWVVLNNNSVNSVDSFDGRY